MNADEVVKRLRISATCEIKDTCDNCELPEDEKELCDASLVFTTTYLAAADLIESLQAQLAEAKRRADRAVEDLETAESCITCEHDWDCEYSNSNGCSIANYKWRGDAEEGDPFTKRD